MVKIGDRIQVRPVWAAGELGIRQAGPREAVVVWIHPQGRFYMVEYRMPGGTIRECFS